jgi:hypothetical protein
MMDEFEDPQDSREGWDMMQRLIWAFMTEHTGENLAGLYFAFEKWVESKTEEELNEIFAAAADEESIERNLEEEGRLHSKEDILRGMWNDDE